MGKKNVEISFLQKSVMSITRILMSFKTKLCDEPLRAPARKEAMTQNLTKTTTHLKQ